MDDTKAYIEQRDGGYWIAGTRISLASVVYAFNRGAAPESIARSFPLLTLEEAYGAITYYLAHEQEINDYLAQGDAELAALRLESRDALRRTRPELIVRIETARQHSEPTVP